MDLEAFTHAKGPTWRQLERLTKKRKLSATESEVMLDVYLQTGIHLSNLRSNAPDPTLVMALSSLLARARRKMALSQSSSWHAFAGFWLYSLPAALYRLRWWWGIVAIVNVLFIAGFATWLHMYPENESLLGSQRVIEHLVEHDFEDYYHQAAAADFSFQVWTNNAFLALQCIAFGIAGFPIFKLLFSNSLNVGLSGGVMWNHGGGLKFLGLILPHGLLELTAVFVAAGAGLALAWSWIYPTQKTRLAALGNMGRTVVGVGTGLIVILGISGLIEGFVTPSPLPSWSRVAIGVLAEGAFLLYALGLGKAAYYSGHDGDIDQRYRMDETVTVY
ncbi:MAG: stage II sporulation protein M [Actinomycetaceae bacterium]|nr:stage II sporulation protein M [Actinomycetaceae bacterium]